MENECISHHGVIGQKWGIRNYQNADGSLTSKGRQRYQKTMKKADTLHKRSEDAKLKSAKYSEKHAKAAYKLTKKKAKPRLTDFYDAEVRRLDKKQAKYAVKSAKQAKVSIKYEQKAEKMVAKLNRDFGAVKIKDLDQDTIDLGRKYGLSMR